MDSEQDSLTEFYSEISPKFEARTLQLMADYEEENLRILPAIQLLLRLIQT